MRHFVIPIGVVEGGISIQKEEGRLKRLARKKGSVSNPNVDIFVSVEGIQVLREDRPIGNRVT